MKRLMIVLALFLFSVGLSAQSSAYNKEVYRDYGTFKLATDEGNIVSLGAFTTITEEKNAAHVKEDMSKKEMKQMQYAEPEIEYHYELYLVSKSVFEGDSTNTWVKGLRIFVDGEDALIKQFPQGMTLSIGIDPTLIYTHHCDNQFCEFEVTWEAAIYEPRIRK